MDPLPKDWIAQIEIADEFEVRRMSTLTMIYIVQKNDVATALARNCLNFSKNLKILDEFLPHEPETKPIEEPVPEKLIEMPSTNDKENLFLLKVSFLKFEI